MRSDEYTSRLDEGIYKSRNEDEELKVAKDIMDEYQLIAAIQLTSKENELRLSIVKPAIKDFSQVPINESEYFDRFLSRILYHRITKPLTLSDGFEATFVSTIVTRSEIRNKLMIMLIAVIGMFFITFVLILVNPRKQDKPKSAYEEDLNSGFSDKSEIESKVEAPGNPDYMPPEDNAPGTYHGSDGGIEDFAPADRFDENDLLVNMPEYGESLSMEEDALPSLDTNEIESNKQAAIMNRLNKELENTAASNQDLSLIIIRGDSNIDEFIREHYPHPSPVFSIDRQRTAVIETNKDFDSSIYTAREFLRECLSKNSNLGVFCGIAARNGRLISADVLYHEAASALLKADNESRIVGFRSNPEKYRDFIRNQEIN